MRIETTTQPCGFKAYSALDVPHDWNPKPLNVCAACGRGVERWTVYVGHWCDNCKTSACDLACTDSFWSRAA